VARAEAGQKQQVAHPAGVRVEADRRRGAGGGGAVAHDSSPGVRMQMVLGSVKKRSASSPPSRPTPDCLTPPNGTRRSRKSQQLTQTVPHSRASATRCDRPRSRVHNEADSPKRVLLARRTASASPSNGATLTTGPKISSWSVAQPGGRSAITVGD